MTFVLPGGIGQLSAGALSAWDPTTTGWGNFPSLAAAAATWGPAPGTLGGPSIAPLLAPTSITETFGTVENPLSHGGQWQHQTVYWANMAVGNFSLPASTHVCYGLQTGANLYGDAYSYLSPLVWPPSHTDYTVAATVNVNNALGPGDIDEFELVLRVNDSPSPGGTGTVTLYECNYQLFGVYTQFVAWDGTPGTFTILYPGPGSQPALVTGDVISATIQGLTVTFKHNGTTLYTQTDPGTGGGDPNYTGPFNVGQPGIAKFYQTSSGGVGPGDHFGFTQVVVTSAPFTAPVPQTLTASVASTATAGTIIGQIPCQHNPTSWAFVGAPPPGLPAGAVAIDSFANVVVQAAGVGAMTPGGYVLTAQATNSFGSNTAAVRLTVTSASGPIFSNGNRTIIDGDNSHGHPLAVRGKKSVLTTGTTASRRRYFETQLGNVGENPSLGSTDFVSAGVVITAWNAVTTSGLPLGMDTAGLSVGLQANGSVYVLAFAGSGLFGLLIAPTSGDLIGIAVDTSGVAPNTNTAVWFNINGLWVNGGHGPTGTFPGLSAPDMTFPTLTQVWPAGTTDFSTHVTINPSPRQLHTPSGFLALG